MLKLLATIGLLLVAVNAKADRKIYSCKDANGNAVFSSQPCGKEAKEVPYDAGQSTAPLPDGTIPPTAPNTQMNNAVRDISDGVADSDCRRSAKRNAVYPIDAPIQELERRKRNLEKQASYANNNLAGATYESGIRQQIGDLDIAISQERTRMSEETARADTDYRAAIGECDRMKAERVQIRSSGN